MKVLLITNDPTILDQGSSGHARALANSIAIGELHVLMVGEKASTRDEGSLRITVVKAGVLSRYAPLLPAARSLVTHHGIHAIWSQDPFELGEIAADVAKSAGLPLYVNIYTDFLSPWYAMSGIFRSTSVPVPANNEKNRARAARVLPQAKGIRVMSERVKKSLVEKYGTHIVEPTVIPVQVNMVPAERVPFPPPAFPFSLMVAGRLDAGRRVVDVIDAVAQIHDRYPSVGLYVVGDGPERAALERHVRKLKLTDRVVFLGDRRDTQGLMRSANVFVQASAHEGYGRRILQAAIARVPIITTDVGIVGEVFKGYDQVLSVPPGDPSAIATHIMGLVEDTSTRELLARSAETVAKAFLQQNGDIPKRLAAFLAAHTETPSSPEPVVYAKDHHDA